MSQSRNRKSTYPDGSETVSKERRDLSSTRSKDSTDGSTTRLQQPASIPDIDAEIPTKYQKEIKRLPRVCLSLDKKLFYTNI